MVFQLASPPLAGTKRQRIQGVVARIESLRRVKSLEVDESGLATHAPLRRTLTRPPAGRGPPTMAALGRRSPEETELNLVQEELEKLNIATDVINKLELQLDEARAAFGEIRSTWSGQLEELSRRLGGCIAKSRPYYEAKLRAKQRQEEARKAVLRFQRANSVHAVAKQQVALTQDSLARQSPGSVDPACLEVLNHHICRVNEAEVERLSSEDEHRRISQLVEEANAEVQALEKECGRSVKRSKAYFDRRLEFTKVLEEQKALIQRIEVEVRQKKADYQGSLRNLEAISERIHASRRLGEPEHVEGSEEDEETEEDTSEPPTPDPSVRTVLVRLDREHQGLVSPSPQVKQLLSRCPSKPRTASQPPAPREEPIAETRTRGGSLSIPTGDAGILLLAQRLAAAGLLGEEDKAFALPPEDLDLAYRTRPEGVPPSPEVRPDAIFLSPPPTPSRCHSREASDAGSSDGGSSLSARSIGGDAAGLAAVLAAHDEMLREREAAGSQLNSPKFQGNVSPGEGEALGETEH